MRLSDHLMEARGTENDICGMVTSMCAVIGRAQRFVLSDDVAAAGFQVMQAKPSSVLAAMPLCRLPYPNMWVEFSGGLALRMGESDHRDPTRAPAPDKVGCLIESDDEGGQAVFMTWAWMHKQTGINVGPFGVVVDWHRDADVRETVHRMIAEVTAEVGHNGGGMMPLLIERAKRGWLAAPPPAAEVLTSLNRREWKRHAHSTKEQEAAQALIRHAAVFVSRHAWPLFIQAGDSMLRDPTIVDVLQGWETDIEGEAPFMEAIIAMMNSKNAVEHVPADLAKLNRSRAKRGRAPFLDHAVTQLTMSRRMARAVAAGTVTREAASQHDVRGHFKLRRTGVFWWTPFERGDPTRGTIARQAYEVVQ